MTTPYRLHYAPDNASLIVRLALEELGLGYETALVDRRTRAQKSPAYLRLNPGGLIPVLETPHGPIFETAAILLWLSDTHGGLGPAPDAPDRGGFLKWLFFVSNTVHPAMRMLFYAEQYVGPDPDMQAALCHHAKSSLSDHLSRLDRLAGSDTSWFAAQAPSALDLYLACALRWMALYPANEAGWLDLSAYGHLVDLVTRLEPRASVQQAIRAEGLGPWPFTRPTPPNPPEGSAI